MLFTDVAGNVPVRQSLIAQVNNGRISHGQLFYGQEGSGALSMALAFATYIFCDNRKDSDACGTCPSCIKMDKLIHPDFHIFFPLNSVKNNTKPLSIDFIEDWRKMVGQNPYLNLFDWLKELGIENKQGIISTEESSQIIQKLILNSFEGSYKVVLIWMAECLNTNAANRLLKIIEEPPDQTLFLLVCEDRTQFLPTILSRLQLIKLQLPSTNEVATYLVNNYGISENEAARIAVLSNGNINKAIKLVNEAGEFEQSLENFIEWMRLCYRIQMKQTINWIDRINESGRENQKNFLSFTLELLRSAWLLGTKSEQVIYMNEAEKEKLLKFSKFIHNENISPIYDLIEKAYLSLEGNASTKMLFLNLTLKLNKLLGQSVAASQTA